MRMISFRKQLLRLPIKYLVLHYAIRRDSTCPSSREIFAALAQFGLENSRFGIAQWSTTDDRQTPRPLSPLVRFALESEPLFPAKCPQKEAIFSRQLAHCRGWRCADCPYHRGALDVIVKKNRISLRLTNCSNSHFFCARSLSASVHGTRSFISGNS